MSSRTAPAAGAVPTAAELIRLLDAEGAVIYAIDGQSLSIVDIFPAHPSACSLKLQVGFGVTGLVARTRKPVLLDADSLRNALHGAARPRRPPVTRTVVCWSEMPPGWLSFVTRPQASWRGGSTTRWPQANCPTLTLCCWLAGFPRFAKAFRSRLAAAPTVKNCTRSLIWPWQAGRNPRVAYGTIHAVAYSNG